MKNIIIMLAVLLPNISFGLITADVAMSSFYVALEEEDTTIPKDQTILKFDLSEKNVLIEYRNHFNVLWSDWDTLAFNSEKNIIDTLTSGEYQFRLTKEDFEIVYGTATLKSQHYQEIKVYFSEYIEMEIYDLKPAIYIYSEEKTTFNLKIEPAGKFTYTFPEPTENGWNVTVDKDGLICNGKPYDYLYWDGVQNQLDFNYNFGFVFKGEETAQFLEAKLKEIGLNARETQDFIAFWGPKLQSNEYNYVNFIIDEDYNEKIGRMETSEEAESVLRVYMAYKPMSFFVPTLDQEFKPFSRKGLTIIEWGGGEVFNQQVGL